MSMGSMMPEGSGSQDQSNSQAQIPMDPITNRLFHAYSDVDSDSSAQHHTLGGGVNQAASGAHTHDGNNSTLLFSGTVTGSRGGNAAVANLISVICQQTGIIDGTTP